MMRTFKITILLAILFFNITKSNFTIDLKGEWSFAIDSERKGESQNWPNLLLQEKVFLPGSMAENKKGSKTTESIFGCLTPTYKYEGVAWYNREIVIPDSWENKLIDLKLERVLWESTVFIDGKKLSVKDALGTAHIHKLGSLKPGKHIIAIRVDNSLVHNIGDKGHAYGEYTQSIWNGIVGDIQLNAYDKLFIDKIFVEPNIQKKEIKLRYSINSPSENKKLKLTCVIKNLSGKLIRSQSTLLKVSKGVSNHQLYIEKLKELNTWSEYNPYLYKLELILESDESNDRKEVEFGFRDVKHNGTKVLVNNIPTFLRGNLDCVHFPKTGYPSCNVEDWIRIFKKYKDYGLNHVRFHSWCPPEAAFKAADRLGIYIQAEASLWIDWWMGEDNVKRGRPEMETKGRPKGLGSDEDADKFIENELTRVVETYYNHPSFIMVCIGNELGNSDFSLMDKWISKLKNKYPRILYSASTARKINKSDDYCATHYIQNIGGTRGLRGAKTNWDFEKSYSKSNIPIIAHEIGQWPVYPKWSEIDKYDGVLMARNFEEFKEVAIKNGIVDQDIKFCNASGALNQLMYKNEIESFLRTKSCAGMQLLSMQDYQGQGEALVGWLDCNWDEKGFADPTAFRNHCNTSVPLLRIPKFVWKNTEVLNAELEVSHHALEDIEANIKYEILDEQNTILYQHKLGKFKLINGTNTPIGKLKYDLSKITKAKKLTIRVALEGTEFQNSWNVWVYPHKNDLNTQAVKVFSEFSTELKSALNKGEKVLLVANNLGDESTSVKHHFYPLYWSLTFFPGQGKTNIGLLLKDKHPLFNDFPTSFHSDWQWESIMKNAKAFYLNDCDKTYKPIAQPIDDFHRNNKLGSIFEFKVGKGKLLVCGYDLNSENIVSNQLKKSILKYMNSDYYNPSYECNVERLEKMFYHPQVLENSYKSAFENVIFDINCASKLKQKNQNISWKKQYDELLKAESVDYKVKVEGVWKDSHVAAWHGKNMNIEIKCPEGILGTLYLQFNDWNNLNRAGEIIFEGRKFKLESHNKKGDWIKLHIMREDSNDGVLRISTKAVSGPNLMLTKMVIEKK